MSRLVIIDDDNNIEIHIKSKNRVNNSSILDGLSDDILRDATRNTNRADYPMGSNTQKEEDYLDKSLVEIFASIGAESKEDAFPQEQRKKRKRNIESYMYNGDEYLKAGKLYLKISPDDTCLQIGHTTYYKYRTRPFNEA